MFFNRQARLKADLILLLAAAAWGSGFVAQRVASAHLGFFVFNGTRFLLGLLLILPLARFRLKLNPSDWRWAGFAGLLLFGASGLQQAGIRTTSAANAGFITGIYVILVPFILVLFFRKRLPLLVWPAALLAVVGTYLLSSNGLDQLTSGDGLIFLGAFLWALHVIVVGRMAERAEPLSFAIGQFLVCGTISLAAGLLFQSDSLAGLSAGGWAILYSAVFSIAIGFTLQVVAQQYTPASDAALVLSMEAPFAALFGYLFLQEALTTLQLVGCGCILVAILLAQIKSSRQTPQTDALKTGKIGQ